MNIVYIIPGAGGTFYCENCVRDVEMVRSLRQAGHDVVAVPLYLPMLYDAERELGVSPVFYGAINVYMKQVSRLFRHAPAFLQRALDSSVLLKWAAGKAESTRARGHEEMTLSMLRGEDGKQASELARLVRWLGNEIKPDVVHLSNALLSGLASRIRRDLGVPVVCSLQDEDTWVNAMDADYGQRTWELLARNADDIGAFVAVSRFYADIMRDYMRVPADKMHVVYPGVNVGEYKRADLDLDPPVIGFLARMAEPLGLDALAASFAKLKKEGFPGLQLRIAGGGTGDNDAFVRDIMRRLYEDGVSGDVEMCRSLDRAARVEFMKELDVLAVPVRAATAFGMYVIEAMAAGVPVVEPHHGAFPELVGETGAGALYDPTTDESLTETLRSVLGDPARLRAFGKAGHEYAVEHLDVSHGARSTLSIYEQVTRG